MESITKVSVVIPTYNGARRIGRCLDALRANTGLRQVEIIVVNDGSTDDTAEVVGRYPDVRLIQQANAGPAAARNRGAREASGAIILFTDDDCEPAAGWLEAMLQPFEDPAVVGSKGVYRTRQISLVARFVQAEYEDRYRLMANCSEIDFVDTYSAAFRRGRFLELNGYDTGFPVACAEDIDLSYRMSARRWILRFAPEAVVYHHHPDSLGRYMKKKFKFALWRVVALRKNPQKALRDSHTPQLMKIQLLFGPAVLWWAAAESRWKPGLPVARAVAAAFLMSTLPFCFRAMAKDPLLGMASPFILAARSCSQLLGVACGVVFAARKRG